MSHPTSTPAHDCPAVVVYSGGMDSFTLLHRALREHSSVHALSFDYGQRHSRELEMAQQVCKTLGIAHQVVDIRAIHGLIDGSSLTDASQPLPTGRYAADNMQSTVVPNRNMILLSMSIAKAINIGARDVYYGAHAGDHLIYPDCRPEFVAAMQHAAGLADCNPVKVHAPYLHASKADILADGLQMGLDYTNTWTCYLGEAFACGECGSCIDRLDAFAANGIDDPVAYASIPSDRPTARGE
ncbi:7-cyano-7-deazaguanine synthase QueC [Halomonas halocynthiae]|uniref:7-cyano-7-deazaguanine synthase QueC n=1 Tax=Halomonas halocynthiae TaxID=176290 RepID=UPI0003F6268C|nr:7-cyano-7-deazaguanine synthase QueC [Halomonas halocynthiae]